MTENRLYNKPKPRDINNVKTYWKVDSVTTNPEIEVAKLLYLSEDYKSFDSNKSQFEHDVVHMLGGEILEHALTGPNRDRILEIIDKIEFPRNFLDTFSPKGEILVSALDEVFNEYQIVKIKEGQEIPEGDYIRFGPESRLTKPHNQAVCAQEGFLENTITQLPRQIAEKNLDKDLKNLGNDIQI
jgi:hypothetical protein